jgi:excisionase family DNA binding protein
MSRTDLARSADVPELLSPERLGAQWCIKPDTVRALVRRGALPAVKIGRLVRIRTVDAQRFLEGSRRA